MKVPSSRRSATVAVGDVAESVDELGEREARGGVGVEGSAGPAGGAPRKPAPLERCGGAGETDAAIPSLRGGHA